MIVIPLLMHICLTKDRAQIQGGNVPVILLQYLSPQLIIPGLIITLRTSEMPILSTASVRLPDYILLPLFIAPTLIWSLTISFYTHHVTMRDVGFKSPSLQHPPNQLASLNQ